MSYIDLVIQFLLLGICCGTISYTITKGSIFESLRRKIFLRNQWFGKLFLCPYCMSHWIAFGAMLVYQPRMVVSNNLIADYVVTGFALTGLSALFAATIFKLFYTKED